MSINSSPISKTKAFFLKHKLQNSKIAIAFSGGIDSTALFFMLLELRVELNLSLSAIHINYKLRGADSDGDEKFVRDLCQKHNIKLFIKVADLSNQKSKIEETARNERYEFFAEIKKLQNIDSIATAHNANDQAETLLFRLARGTGILGAASIKAIREDGIIRPMLNITRAEILDYLHTNGHKYRIDKTNTDVNFARNRIRENVTPELEKINPNAVLNIAKFAAEVAVTEQLSDSGKFDYLNKSVEKKDSFLLEKKTRIDEISEICYQNGLILSDIQKNSIEKSRSNTGATLLLPNFRMFVLKSFFVFLKNGTVLPEIVEIEINENSKSQNINDFWKIEILDVQPQKGENFAVVQKSDFPLMIKLLSKNAKLKNDNKSANERMKKVGLSKFERDHSPAIFSATGDLLAATGISWKFDKKTEAWKWVRVEMKKQETTFL